MKNSIKILICFFICLAFHFCTKQKSYELNKGNCIIIGDITNLNLVNYNKSITPGYISTNLYDIDVDQDNQIDFQLRNVSTTRTNWYEKSIDIICMNDNCQIFGQIANDTTFLFDTTITYQTNTSQSITVTNTLQNLYYNCFKQDKRYVISSIKNNALHMQSLAKNDRLYNTNECKSDTIIFTQFASSILSANNTNAGQKLTNHIISNDCLGFNPSKEFYIGIKILKPNFEHLGWIKLKIDNSIVTLIETAIQN